MLRRPRSLVPFLLLASLSVAACGDSDETPDPGATDRDEAHRHDGVADLTGDPGSELDLASLEGGRNDPGWKRYVQLDTVGSEVGGEASETVDDITPERVNGGRYDLPVGDGMEGPSVLAVQVLLDRARFSPGVMDGRWGKNTEKAVVWFQRENGLPATGRVDAVTLERLRGASPASQLVAQRVLTTSDVEGPFTDIPSDIYEKAKLDCMCYESVLEKLAEIAHTTPELLERLNPGVDLLAVRAGDRLLVPTVTEDRDTPGQIARIVVSGGGSFVHAEDASGRILYHFPSTLGSKYAPSPSGGYQIESVHPDPMWHYQPDLLTGVPDGEPAAMIPAGPNNAVGVVWMQLSKPHYGIHGTSAPETIGYATSHGCVRLTNWDARTLSRHVASGVPVDFIDSAAGG